jgi:hypothetical protein
MPTISYPTKQEIPDYSHSWENSEFFPRALVDALRQQFPDWEDLRHALQAQNHTCMYVLLDTYAHKLLLAKAQTLSHADCLVIDETLQFMRETLREYGYDPNIPTCLK